MCPTAGRPHVLLKRIASVSNVTFVDYDLDFSVTCLRSLMSVGGLKIVKGYAAIVSLLQQPGHGPYRICGGFSGQSRLTMPFRDFLRRLWCCLWLCKKHNIAYAYCAMRNSPFLAYQKNYNQGMTPRRAMLKLKPEANAIMIMNVGCV